MIKSKIWVSLMFNNNISCPTLFCIQRYCCNQFCFEYAWSALCTWYEKSVKKYCPRYTGRVCVSGVYFFRKSHI